MTKHSFLTFLLECLVSTTLQPIILRTYTPVLIILSPWGSQSWCGDDRERSVLAMYSICQILSLVHTPILLPTSMSQYFSSIRFTYRDWWGHIFLNRFRIWIHNPTCHQRRHDKTSNSSNTSSGLIWNHLRWYTGQWYNYTNIQLLFFILWTKFIKRRHNVPFGRSAQVSFPKRVNGFLWNLVLEAYSKSSVAKLIFVHIS
jgi:hypothetical protein